MGEGARKKRAVSGKAEGGAEVAGFARVFLAALPIPGSGAIGLEDWCALVMPPSHPDFARELGGTFVASRSGRCSWDTLERKFGVKPEWLSSRRGGLPDEVRVCEIYVTGESAEPALTPAKIMAAFKDKCRDRFGLFLFGVTLSPSSREEVASLSAKEESEPPQVH